MAGKETTSQQPEAESARTSRSSERLAAMQDVAASSSSSTHREPHTDRARGSAKTRARHSQRGDVGSRNRAPPAAPEDLSSKNDRHGEERRRDKARARKSASQRANLDDPTFVRSLKQEVFEKTEALPREIRRRFGEIVWVKLNGYPYWPGLIMDPRKLPPSMQLAANKGIGSKFWLYFYGTHDFASISYKRVVPWNDDTYPYREGFPAKDAKTPTRKEQLAAALDEADSEQSLPLTVRIDWLVKDVPVEAPAPKRRKDKTKEREKAEKKQEPPAPSPAGSDPKSSRHPRSGTTQIANTQEEDTPSKSHSMKQQVKDEAKRPVHEDTGRRLSVRLIKRGQSYVTSPTQTPQQSPLPPRELASSRTDEPLSARRERSAKRTERPSPSEDSDIDFALALIQNVRSRAGGASSARVTADIVKPDPERDFSQRHPSASHHDVRTNSRARSTDSTRSSSGSAKRLRAGHGPSAVVPSRSTRSSRVVEEPRAQERNSVVNEPQGQISHSESQQTHPRQLNAPEPACEWSTLPRRRNPALVIFNKDGTLIDFNSMWGGWIESQAWKLEASAKLAIREQFYCAMGYDWNRRSVARFGALSTLPKKDLSRVAVDVLLTKGMALREAQRVVLECWSFPDPVMTCRPLADIPDIFRTIKQMGIKIAIRTTDNRESTKKSLAHMHLTELVDDMVCGDDGLPIAPSPEQVWTLCNRLGVGVYNTVMVGDTPSDMVLGRNSACSLSVGVFGGASALDDLAKDADILISSLDKITRVLFQYGQQASQQQ